jgi:thioesterase superfamily protein 4
MAPVERSAGTNPHRPSAEIKAQFESAPWVLKHFDDPTLRAIDNDSRDIKISSTADTFVSQTLATYDTIRAWQSFYKPPNDSKKFGEIIACLSLGSGVNGHVDTSHGGFISLLHDEVLGGAAENARPAKMSTMTAYLKVDYKKPMKTPAIILCRAWVERREGKKIYVRGTIETEKGVISSLGEGLFIIIEKVKPSEKL